MKHRTLTAKLKLPFIEFFEDYHDIRLKLYELREMFGDNKIMSKEATFSPILYTGLFYYRGEKPSEGDIKSLIDLSAGVKSF